MARPAVAVHGMRVGHGSFVVLEDVDLTVADGEIVAVTVLGLAAGPGVAAVALRIARTAPINPADQGPDAPVTAPPWLLTRAGSVLLGLIAAWPTLRAVYTGHVDASTFGAQVVVAAAVLGGYLMIAVRRSSM